MMPASKPTQERLQWHADAMHRALLLEIAKFKFHTQAMPFGKRWIYPICVIIILTITPFAMVFGAMRRYCRFAHAVITSQLHEKDK